MDTILCSSNDGSRIQLTHSTSSKGTPMFYLEIIDSADEVSESVVFENKEQLDALATHLLKLYERLEEM